MATRRELMTGTAAMTAAAIMPATALPLTAAQEFERTTLMRRYRSVMHQLARYVAIPEPTPAEKAMISMYEQCRDQAIDALTEAMRPPALPK